MTIGALQRNTQSTSDNTAVNLLFHTCNYHSAASNLWRFASDDPLNSDYDSITSAACCAISLPSSRTVDSRFAGFINATRPEVRLRFNTTRFAVGQNAYPVRTACDCIAFVKYIHQTCTVCTENVTDRTSVIAIHS